MKLYSGGEVLFKDNCIGDYRMISSLYIVLSQFLLWNQHWFTQITVKFLLNSRDLSLPVTHHLLWIELEPFQILTYNPNLLLPGHCAGNQSLRAYCTGLAVSICVQKGPGGKSSQNQTFRLAVSHLSEEWGITLSDLSHPVCTVFWAILPAPLIVFKWDCLTIVWRLLYIF